MIEAERSTQSVDGGHWKIVLQNNIAPEPQSVTRSPDAPILLLAKSALQIATLIAEERNGTAIAVRRSGSSA